MEIVGQIIFGNFGNILVRQKSGKRIEVGELLIADTENGKILLQVYDLAYGSQLSQQHLELISGMRLDEGSSLELMDRELRSYTLASLKSLIMIEGEKVKICKTLPGFLSNVREIEKEDLAFLTKPNNPLFIGKLRTGSKTLDWNIFLDGEKVLAHHVLIPAQTGKGKSNLARCMLWDLVDKDYCGVLVFDPHDEYYGRNKAGLKDHPNPEKVVYYTSKNPPPGARTLKINIKCVTPNHFNGVVNWTDAQEEGLYSYYKNYGEDWIRAILLGEKVIGFQESTLEVIKRRLLWLLDLQLKEGIVSNGIFSYGAGDNTLKDMVQELENGKTVIIDTSNFYGSVELLLGSLVSTEVLKRYRSYKASGELDKKPVIAILLEEAPRVLGKDVLERSQNIFSAIAREGRKFRIGLIAITQLPSLIPRQILANMNTKIILGLEMAPERAAVIESSAQDLSEDNRTIASLDIGEAIVTSNFSRFATPVKIPLFEELIKNSDIKQKQKRSFPGVKLS